MHLHEWSTLTEAAEWLAENKDERWSWKVVVEKYSELNTDTVHVVVPVGRRLTQVSPGKVQEIEFHYPVRLKVCNVWNFLADILMGADFASAKAYPLALVDDSYARRYQCLTPIPASEIQLSKAEIWRLADLPPLDPFRTLVNEIYVGLQPELTAAARPVSDEGKEVVKLPGTRPKTANGQLGVEAAWELELELGRRPNVNEVMDRLIMWAGNGTKSSVLMAAGKDGRSVEWVTDKGKPNNYGREALGKTLKMWWKSRG